MKKKSRFRRRILKSRRFPTAALQIRVREYQFSAEAVKRILVRQDPPVIIIIIII